MVMALVLSCANKDKPSQLYDSKEAETSDVWICLGTSSHAFHLKRNCKGMKKCKGKKRKISLREAYSMERTPCHYCCDERTYRDQYDPDRYDPMNSEKETYN